MKPNVSNRGWRIIAGPSHSTEKETLDITGWPDKTAPAVKAGLKEHPLAG